MTIASMATSSLLPTSMAYGGVRNAFFTVSYDVNTKKVSAYSQLSEDITPLVKYDIDSHLYLTSESFN